MLSTKCVYKSYIWLLLFVLFEFFTRAVATGFSLESEWQQVSSSLQDSSQYSGWPQQCCYWMVSSYFYIQVLQSFYQSFGDFTECTNYNWYNRHFHVPQFVFFQFPSKVQVLIFLFAFCQFYSVVSRDCKVHKSLFFTPWEFFTSANADVFSLEFELQQVSLSLQDSSQYFGRSQ